MKRYKNCVLDRKLPPLVNVVCTWFKWNKTMNYASPDLCNNSPFKIWLELKEWKSNKTECNSFISPDSFYGNLHALEFTACRDNMSTPEFPSSINVTAFVGKKIYISRDLSFTYLNDIVVLFSLQDSYQFRSLWFIVKNLSSTVVFLLSV